MELIKKEEQKLFCSYELGTITEENNNTKEKVNYTARLTARMEPMIIFPDGDIAVFTWEDILAFAKALKKKEDKEGENDRK